jgi:hypothetical protein
MDAGTVLLALAVLCFVFQAFDFALGTFKPAWWALGVAFYLSVGLVK